MLHLRLFLILMNYAKQLDTHLLFVFVFLDTATILVHRLQENESNVDFIRKFVAVIGCNENDNNYNHNLYEISEDAELMRLLSPIVEYQQRDWQTIIKDLEWVANHCHTTLDVVTTYFAKTWHIDIDRSQELSAEVEMCMINQIDINLNSIEMKDESEENMMLTIQHHDSNEEQKRNDMTSNYDLIYDNIKTNISTDDAENATFYKHKSDLVSSVTSSNQNTQNLFVLEIIYTLFVESLSMADLITDGIVLHQLIESNHQWWSAFMLLTIVSPYVVSYSALVM